MNTLENKFGIVKEIPNKMAIEMVINFHYAHRRPSNSSLSYGLFKDDNLVGCIIYGNPFAIKINKSILNDINKFKILELNRLFIYDYMPKNTESFLIGQSFKFLPKPVVLVSYADTGQNHSGYIYQATNWIYTGLTDKSGCYSRIIINGKERSSKSFYDELGTQSKQKILEKYPNAIFIPYTVKHRYVFFLGTKNGKKEFMKILKPEIKPYPKLNKIDVL